MLFSPGMLKFETDRAVAFYDIEATGTNPRTDRIIDLAIVKILPSGHSEEHHWRVNPERPIPADATAIHGPAVVAVHGRVGRADAAGGVDARSRVLQADVASSGQVDAPRARPGRVAEDVGRGPG